VSEEAPANRDPTCRGVRPRRLRVGLLVLDGRPSTLVDRGRGLLVSAAGLGCAVPARSGESNRLDPMDHVGHAGAGARAPSPGVGAGSRVA